MKKELFINFLQWWNDCLLDTTSFTTTGPGGTLPCTATAFITRLATVPGLVQLGVTFDGGKNAINNFRDLGCLIPGTLSDGFLSGHLMGINNFHTSVRIETSVF